MFFVWGSTVGDVATSWAHGTFKVFTGFSGFLAPHKILGGLATLNWLASN